MKKIFFYTATLCFAVAMFVKCKPAEQEGIMYNYYFTTHWANSEDSIKVENYLKPKKLAKTMVFNGSINDADRQAIKLFEELASQISVTELDNFHLDPTTSFMYAVNRWKNPNNPLSEPIIIESFIYP